MIFDKIKDMFRRNKDGLKLSKDLMNKDTDNSKDADNNKDTNNKEYEINDLSDYNSDIPPSDDIKETTTEETDKIVTDNKEEINNVEESNINRDEVVEATVDYNQNEEVSKDIESEAIPKEEAKPITQGDNEEVNPEDIDAMINQLLEEDARTELIEGNNDFINDVSVYDTVEKESNEEILEEIADDDEVAEVEEDSKQFMIFYIIIGALILLIIATCMFLLIQVNKYKKSLIAKEQGVLIEQPEYRANNANYIYVPQEAILHASNNKEEEIKIKLSKILFDSIATLFYFDSNIDLHKYNVMLVDDRNNMYNMDLSFVQSTNTKPDGKGTILRFEPVFHTAKSVTLTISNPENHEKVDFHFTMTEPIENTPVKYVFNQPMNSGNSNININIDNAAFSSAGSRIEYTLTWSEGNYFIVQQNQNNENNIILEEGISVISPTKSYPSIYSFNDGETILGRMDFESISNLNSKVTITFKNLFKKYVVNKNIPASELSSRGENKSHSIDIDNYKVVFEGLGLFEDKYVLVAHAEDKSIQLSDKDSTDNRVRVEFDLELVAKSPSGMEVILNGKCTSAQYGTDVVIPIDENAKNFVYGIDRENLNIRVKSILIETEPISTSIELSKMPNENDIIREEAERDIIETFEKRLEYKSGTRNFVALSGFTDEVLKDKILFQDYTPQELVEPAKFSAQVISSFMENNKYHAVVQESWTGAIEVGGEVQEIQYYCTHKIVATKGEISWIIIDDNIIK